MRWIWKGRASKFEMTDEEYVRRLRRNLAVWDRSRRWLLAFNVGFAVAFIGLLVKAVQVLQGFVQLGGMRQGLTPVFLVGVLVGASLGGMAIKLVHYFVISLTPPHTERLLLKYYDALMELDQESAASCQSEESRV